ncbi:MAG: clan AA aspartic protease [Clostridiales bacterium]|nr:clan AA aspartic protease [Clostridiales bacterium]
MSRCKITKIKKSRNKDFSRYDDLISEVESASLTMSEASEEFYNIIAELPVLKVEPTEGGVYALKKNIMGMLCVEVTIHEKKYDFLLDTGAEISCVSNLFIKEGTTIKEVSVGAADGHKKSMSLCAFDCIEVLGATFKNLPMLILEDQMTFSLLGRTVYKLDGIVGWDILSQFDFTISKDKLLIKASEAFPEETLNFPRSTFPVITLDHQGEQRTFGFDTGAKKSWINETLIEKDHLKIVKYQNKKHFGAHGSYMQAVKVIKSYDLELIDYQISFKQLETGFTGLLNDYELDGVLGIDILKKNAIEISNSKGSFRFV